MVQGLNLASPAAPAGTTTTYYAPTSWNTYVPGTPSTVPQTAGVKATSRPSLTNQTASVSTPLRSSAPTAPVVTPTATPTPAASPGTVPSSQTSNDAVFSAPFFSWKGQRERLRNVGAVLSIAVNPFTNDRIQANVDSGFLRTPLEAVANHPYLTAGVAAGGITAVRAIGSRSLGVSSVSGVAGSNALRTAAIAGGAGLVVGALLNGGGKQTQGSTQTQSLPGISNPVQQPTWNYTDNSIRKQNTRQDTYNQIIGSPGASINSSPSLRAEQPQATSFSPSQAAPFDQTAGQTASQTATQESSWLLPALIVGAALILSRN